MPVVSIVVPFFGLTKYIGLGSYKVTPKRNYNGDFGLEKATLRPNPKPYGALTGPSGPLVGTLIGYRPICTRDLVEAPYILP